ncbi:hypothetical protein N431DRAFT_558805 [Stipitochalara longipes BDJ]|nr:hypothetical protein N431DRAFT_558805 [Stipitochalara longipes BDJ]
MQNDLLLLSGDTDNSSIILSSIGYYKKSRDFRTCRQVAIRDAAPTWQGHDEKGAVANGAEEHKPKSDDQHSVVLVCAVHESYSLQYSISRRPGSRARCAGIGAVLRLPKKRKGLCFVGLYLESGKRGELLYRAVLVLQQERVLEPLVLSAFSPQLGCPGWYGDYSQNRYGNCQVADQYNNWIVDLPNDFKSLDSYRVYLTPSYSLDNNFTADLTLFTTQQLWLQSASSETVCILGNASLELDLEYVNNVQTIGSRILEFAPLYMPIPALPASDTMLETSVSLGLTSLDLGVYVAIFTSLTNILSGNITMASSYEPNSSGDPDSAPYLFLDIAEGSSKALQTGLIACQDMKPSYWFGNIKQLFHSKSR